MVTATVEWDTLERVADWWRESLTAAQRSPRTIKTYLEALRDLDKFLASRGMPRSLEGIRREHVEAWQAELTRLGCKPATVALRDRALRVFWKWAISEEKIRVSPMEKMPRPQVPEQPVPVLNEDAIRRLLKACDGRDLRSRRDTAIIRLLLDTGMRLGEVSGLKMDDIDFELHVALVMGKGRRPRSVPFGAKTTIALRRYLDARAKSKHASLPWLWLGPKGRLTENGVYQAFRERSAAAGIGSVHPHQLRHTFAHEWMAAGGLEGDLMHLAGWRSPSMLRRYGQSAAAERARAAHARMGLADKY